MEITNNTLLVCVSLRSINSKGVWNGDNPLSYSGPLLMLQISLICMSIRITAFLLRPLGQPMIVSQIISGILLGPSVLGRDKNLTSKLFPQEAKPIFDTLAWFGLMIYIFLYGVKMDLMIVKQSGRKAILIGLSSFFLPMVLCLVFAFTLRQYLPSDSHLVLSLPYMAISQVLIPFIVLTALLTELRTLNTDLGRLAVSSSVYADLTGMSATVFSYNLGVSRGGPPLTPLWSILSSIALVAVIFILLRPAMNWLSKQMMIQAPEGKPEIGIQFCVVFLLMLVVGFISLMNGQYIAFGPLLFGLAVPKGAPLGSSLDEKLDTLVSCVFLPAFFLMCGLHTDMTTISPKVAGIVGFLAMLACLSRMMAIILSSLYYNIPMRDAMVLGLMLNSRGIAELINFKMMNEAKIFDEQEYAIAVLSILLITAISTPILRILHDPTKSYTTTIRRTIQDTKRNSELRMLVCIQRQENVPTMINLIEVSHANRKNPISVIVLKLVELVGRASPILVAHNNDELPSSQNGGGNTGSNNSGKISSSSSCRYDQIFNAFQQYKLLNEDCISIQQFTAISHVATMHDDVCQVACDKRATIIIVPFHKEWSIDGSISSVNSGLRNMNLNILKKAPCSVGVLVDRGIMQGSLSVITSGSSFYHVAVLLMGGADDGEALAYGSRIALHQHVKVTIIFLNDNNINNKKMVANQMERYKLTNEVNDRIEYREEVVTDGERLGALIRDILEEGNDLTIVGKRQWRDSPLFSGLTEWNECPELGVIGDMLASPDFGTTSSILVVQQQRQVCQTKSTGGSIDITNHGAKTDFSIHDVPMNENDETLRVTLDKMC